MGGLRHKIRWTFLTMMCAAVAIAGVPPFSGFYSKDEILLAAHHHAPWMYWVGVATAGMTAFYIFRAVFLAFFGAPRGEHHPHESPLVMTAPLMVLAALSLVGGKINVPAFLEPMFPRGEVHHDSSLVAISVAAGLAGIALAWLLYIARPALAGALAARAGYLYRLLYGKYFVDELYDAVVVRPVEAISRRLLWRGVDAGLIDGAVNGVGSRAQGIGGVLRKLQSGYIRSYAVWVLAGAVLMLVTVALSGGGR
jgi:NADH-quinone oxidoreductase subunit L